MWKIVMLKKYLGGIAESIFWNLLIIAFLLLFSFCNFNAVASNDVKQPSKNEKIHERIYESSQWPFENSDLHLRVVDISNDSHITFFVE